jgi:hypothetical protein
VFIRFVHRPLSRYLNALVEHGLVLDRMVEPAPPDGFLDRAPSTPRRRDPAPALPPPPPPLTARVAGRAMSEWSGIRAVRSSLVAMRGSVG